MAARELGPGGILVKHLEQRGQGKRFFPRALGGERHLVAACELVVSVRHIAGTGCSPVCVPRAR